MKTNEILAALNLSNTANNKKHCSKLAAVYSFLKEIKPEIISTEIINDKLPLKFGRHTEEVFKGISYGEKTPNWQTEVKSEGVEMTSALFLVTTQTGEYKFAVPIFNSFYSAVCDLLGLQYTVAAPVKEKPIETVLVPSSILAAFGKAAKFVSQDNLRPAMQHVCLAIDHYKVEVVATNAHWLYQSEKVDCSYNGDRLEVLISEQDAIKIGKLKPSYEFIEINILSENRLQIDGFTCNRGNFHYPQYRVVIPEYKDYLSFDRKDLVSAIKSVLPAANRSTSQVNFHINGSIALTAGDIDFNYESQKEISYSAKTIPDTDIAFNGKFLLKSLATFKDKEVKMYSAGVSNQCIIVSNDIETVLLMPLLSAS